MIGLHWIETKADAVGVRLDALLLTHSGLSLEAKPPIKSAS